MRADNSRGYARATERGRPATRRSASPKDCTRPDFHDDEGQKGGTPRKRIEHVSQRGQPARVSRKVGDRHRGTQSLDRMLRGSIAPATLDATRSCKSKMSSRAPSKRSAQMWTPVAASIQLPRDAHPVAASRQQLFESASRNFIASSLPRYGLRMRW